MLKWMTTLYCLLLTFIFTIKGLDLQAKLSLITFGLMVWFWLFEILPQVMVSLLGLSVFMVIFPNELDMTLSGFSSPILFFVLGSSIVGQAIISCGLASRLVVWLLRFAAFSPTKLINQLILFLPLTPLLLPSATSRNAVLVPMYEDILQQMKIPKNANLSRKTMLILGILNPTVSSAFLTGGTAPVIAAKMLGPFTWLQWFSMLAIPCFLIFFLGSLYLYARYPLSKNQHFEQAETLTDESHSMVPMTKQQKIMLLIVFGVTILWFTDRWHHLNPAVPVMLGAVTALLVPGLMPWDKLKHSGLWSTFITLGMLMSFIEIMDKAHILEWMTNMLNESLPQTTNPFVIGAYVILISATLHLLIPSIPACLAFTLTLVIHWTEQLGLQPVIFGLMAMLTIDAATIYPTQNTTNMIANESDRTRPLDVFQLGITLLFIVTIVSLFIGIPLWSSHI